MVVVVVIVVAVVVVVLVVVLVVLFCAAHITLRAEVHTENLENVAICVLYCVFLRDPAAN